MRVFLKQFKYRYMFWWDSDTVMEGNGNKAVNWVSTIPNVVPDAFLVDAGDLFYVQKMSIVCKRIDLCLL